MLDRPLALPVDTLARLLEVARVGEPHLTLAPRPTWRPRAARDDLAAARYAELVAAGLVDGRGRVDAELTASLAVLCSPGVEYYGWVHGEGRTIALLAAAIGHEAVLAVRDDELVSVVQVSAQRLPERLVERLPDVPPAGGEPVDVLRSELAAAADGWQSTGSGVGIRPAGSGVRLARRIAELPTTGGGELYVAQRDGGGRRRCTVEPLRFADTGTGRWLNQTTRLPDRDHRILIMPARPANLVDRLYSMYAGLRAN